jgi:DNA-binding NarL/FixJ family response regulator
VTEHPKPSRDSASTREPLVVEDDQSMRRASGLMNKQIAAELGLAEITVKIHRGHITKKMGAKSLADLLRKAETLGTPGARPQRIQTQV